MASLRSTHTYHTWYNAFTKTSETKPIRWTLYADPALIDQFRTLAAEHRRSLNCELIWALEQYACAEKRKGRRDADPQGVLSTASTRRKRRNSICALSCAAAVTSTTVRLPERRACYQMRRQSLGYSAQAAELAEIKAAYPAYQDRRVLVVQDVLRRLDKAFAAFFRRLKNGEQPGYTRFRGEGRYDSFTYPQSGFALAGTILTLSKLGDLKVRLHRPMVGKVKTVTIKRDVNHWYVTCSCEVEEEPLPPCEDAVGIDVGLLHFATLSTGETIENPRHYRRGQKRIALLQQAKDRKKRGSHRRKRAAIARAMAHRKVRNQRKDFQHKAARALVNRFGLIVFEDLKIVNMSAAPNPKPDPDKEGAYLPNGASAKAGLNTSILDAGWGQFQLQCSTKAASAGRRVLFVNPSNTSQRCSSCGELVPKPLEERMHLCPRLGVGDRPRLQRGVKHFVPGRGKWPTMLRRRRSPLL